MPEHQFEAIGTRWVIRTPVPLTTAEITDIDFTTGDFDRNYSRFRADSLVASVAGGSADVEFPAGAHVLFDFYRRLYDLTGGLFTPLIGRALEHLGYGADYSLQPQPDSLMTPAWDDVLTIEGSVVNAAQPVMLDFGAAGKGFLVDLLGTRLQRMGIEDWLIDGSGDMRHRGADNCRIGLENPADPTTAIGIANLRNGALCASATTRRRWGDGLHHIISPHTGRPVDDVLATWVMADSAMIADGIATALFFTDPRVLAEHFDFTYVRMPATGGVEYSIDFDGELFD